MPGNALCNTCRGALLADRFLWVERPVIMRQPRATAEDPCSWPSHDYEARRAAAWKAQQERQERKQERRKFWRNIFRR